jgi:hypothetical protein
LQKGDSGYRINLRQKNRSFKDLVVGPGNGNRKMIKGWESLQMNSLVKVPGTENPKAENPEMPKMKVSKTQKLQSRAELGKVVKLKDFLNIDCYER